MKTVIIEHSKGSNSGQALYLTTKEEDGSESGHRIAGGKCWGYITPVKEWVLSKHDGVEIIEEIRKAFGMKSQLARELKDACYELKMVRNSLDQLEGDKEALEVINEIKDRVDNYLKR